MRATGSRVLTSLSTEYTSRLVTFHQSARALSDDLTVYGKVSAVPAVGVPLKETAELQV